MERKCQNPIVLIRCIVFSLKRIYTEKTIKIEVELGGINK